jgi:hypothetical protein
MVSPLLLEFYRNMFLSAATCRPIFGKLNYSRGGVAFSNRAHITHSRLTKFKGPARAACAAQRTLHGTNLRAFWMYTDECCRVGAGVATDCPLLTVAATAVVPQSEAKFTLFWVGRIGWMIDIMSAAEARWCCGMRLRKPACRHCCSIINVYACFGEEEKILENGSLCSLTYIYKERRLEALWDSISL